MDRNKLYRRYGKVLSKILEHLPGTSKQELHLSLKRAKGIKSLTDLTYKDMSNFLTEIEAHFMSEYGIVLLDDGKSLKEIFDENDNN